MAPKPNSALQLSSLLIIAFLSIAAYNILELLIWIFNFFKRRRGLYFCSILTAITSLSTFVIVAFLSEFHKAPRLATGIGTALIYPILITSQALVLYSRLHLITQGRILRLVLWMLIATSILLLPPFTIVLLGFSTGSTAFASAEPIVESFAVTGSCAREFLICGIYIYQAALQLRPILAMKGRAGRNVMIHLILVDVTVIVLDAFLLLMTFWGRPNMALSYSCASHSVKLKMELGILNRLVGLVEGPMEGALGVEEGYESGFLGLRGRMNEEGRGDRTQGSGSMSGEQLQTQTQTQTQMQMQLGRNGSM